MSLRIERLTWDVLLAVVLGVVVGLMRPTAIGEVYSFPLALLALMIVFLYVLIDRFSYVIVRNHGILIQFLLLTAIAVYLMCHGVILGYLDGGNAIKAFLLVMVPILSIAIVLQRRTMLIHFFDGFASVIFVSCLSIFISFSLLCLGVGYESLHVYDFDYTYEGRGAVIFPVTLIFNPVDFGLGVMPRLGGIYREPGVVPALACWGATYAYLRQWSWWVVLVFLMGSLFSLSSMGVLAFFTGALILFDRIGLRLRSSMILLFMLILFSWPVLYGLDGIGLEAKASSGSGSFEERYEQALGFFGMENVLFGDGPDWSSYGTSAINVLAASRSFGLIYLMSIFGVLLVSMKCRFAFFSGIFPVVVVIFSAQPIVLDAAIIIVWFSWVVFAYSRGGDAKYILEKK